MIKSTNSVIELTRCAHGGISKKNLVAYLLMIIETLTHKFHQCSILTGQVAIEWLTYLVLNIGGDNGWCGVCLKNASPGTYGYCTYGDSHQGDTSRELITKVKRSKHWGFCSDLCSIDSQTNTLKETQLTVLPVKDCAVFNSSVLSYKQNRELCAGNKIDYPTMKVYIRKKLRRPKDGKKYYFIRTKDKNNTVITVTFP